MGVACTINTAHILMDKYVNGSKFYMCGNVCVVVYLSTKSWWWWC